MWTNLPVDKSIQMDKFTVLKDYIYCVYYGFVVACPLIRKITVHGCEGK